MTEVLNVIHRLTSDFRTIGIAVLALAVFYELTATLFPALFGQRRIGIFGVIMVAIGFVLLPAVINYFTTLG